MATAVDAIFVSLGLKTDGLEQGMKKAQSTIARGVKSLSGLLNPLREALSITTLASTFYETAEAIDTLSRQLDMGVETLQLWQGAARQAGVGAGAFDGFLSSLAEEVRGTGRSVEEELLSLNAQFSGLSDMQAQQLGKSKGFSSDLVGFLSMERSELEDLLVAQYEMGILREKDIERALKLGDANTALKRAYTSLSGVLMGAITPALEWATVKATEFVNFLRRHDAFTKAFFIGVAAAITGFMLPALAALAVAVLANPLTWIFAGIAAAIAGVALLIDDLVVSMRGGKSFFDWSPLVDSVRAIWRELEPLIDLLGDLWDVMKSIGDFFHLILAAAVKAGLAYVTTFVKSFTDLIGSAIRFVKALFSGDWAAIWETGKQVAVDTVMFLFRRITGVFEAIKSFLQTLGVWDPLVDALSSVWDAITGTISLITDSIALTVTVTKKLISAFLDWLPGWLRKKLSGGSTDIGVDQKSFAQGLSPEDRARLHQEGYLSAARASDAIAPSRISNATANTNVRVDQTVNQTITTSDPIVAANRATQGVKQETGEATKLALQANQGVNQ